MRLKATDGYKFQFAASADGTSWTPVGANVTGKNLPPWDRSLRVALTVEGGETAEARFDLFRLVPEMTIKD